MNKADKYYKKNINEILVSGSKDFNPRPKYKDGTPAHTKFITQVFEKYDLFNNEFPIPTLRTTAIKTGIKEILWIYQDQNSSLESAHKRGITWWDEWDIGDGTIGQRYGATVKKYNLTDNLLKGLKEDPFSRRHIMNLYQEEDINFTKGLHPCAYETIWSVNKSSDDYYLDMTLIQRSNDYLVAGYINKIQYVALQMMVAGHLGYKLGTFSHFVQNLHVYDRHLQALEEIHNTESLNIQPKLYLKENKDFYSYKIEDFIIADIENIPKIQSSLELAI